MSWYDLANKITRKIKIEPVNDKEFKQKANRPKNTSLA
jgi:dTDP-4-dehydrorhamnose reductase